MRLTKSFRLSIRMTTYENPSPASFAMSGAGPLLGSIDSRQTHTMTDRAPDFIVAVVDDDPTILEALENLLESAGHAVRLFASAAALLESGSLGEIDCLISDIDLPKIDGFELLRLVYAARPQLRVILMTAHHELMNRSSPVGSGHYRLFKKPFNGHELLTAVSEAVRNSHRPVSQS